ncbi:MAG: proteasome subunit beta [Acidimicrobiia bacterium]
MRFPGFGGAYQGSSFSELLEVDHPQIRIGWNELLRDATSLAIPHGTTVLAFKYASGVIVAGDRLATEGHRVASRDVQKVYATDQYSVIAIAGAAGPAIEMARLMRIELEHYEKIEGEALELDGKANKLSQMIRANLPAAMQGLVVVPLFAGYDLRRSEGRVFKYDVTGGRYEELAYATTGSGGVHARNWIKAGFREGMERAEAVDLGLLSLFQAADEDAATGGPDLVRRIYPSVATIDGEGYAMLTDEATEARAQDLLGRGQQL